MIDHSQPVFKFDAEEAKAWVAVLLCLGRLFQCEAMRVSEEDFSSLAFCQARSGAWYRWSKDVIDHRQSMYDISKLKSGVLEEKIELTSGLVKCDISQSAFQRPLIWTCWQHAIKILMYDYASFKNCRVVDSEWGIWRHTRVQGLFLDFRTVVRNFARVLHGAFHKSTNCSRLLTIIWCILDLPISPLICDVDQENSGYTDFSARSQYCLTCKAVIYPRPG